MPTKPTIAAPFAGSGDKNTIPTAPQSGGLASLSDGFPAITEQPVSAGGLPPQRKDFNGILGLLSEFAFYQQSGGLFDWANTLDYTVPAMVVGSDGKLYLALLASGPGGAGAKDPISEPTYWLDYAGSIAPSGPTLEEFYLDGGSIIPAITAGAALALEETSTNKLTQGFLSFQGSTADTHGFFSFRPPSNWDGGTFRAKVIWRGASGCSAGDNVRFYIAAAAAGDGDAEDLALGTAVNIDDTVNTDSTRRNITAASGAITPSGTPAVGDKITFRVSRDYDYGGSPMSEAAQVEAVILQFGITGNIAAW